MSHGVYTAISTDTFEVRVGDQYGLNGRTQVFLPNTMKVVNADRYQAQTWAISANVSAQEITLTPLGVSSQALLIHFTADSPVDLRFNSPSAAILSAVRRLTLMAALSNLYVTTGSTEAMIHVEFVGGSNASVTTSFPLP